MIFLRKMIVFSRFRVDYQRQVMFIFYFDYFEMIFVIFFFTSKFRILISIVLYYLYQQFLNFQFLFIVVDESNVLVVYNRIAKFNLDFCGYFFLVFCYNLQKYFSSILIDRFLLLDICIQTSFEISFFLFIRRKDSICSTIEIFTNSIFFIPYQQKCTDPDPSVLVTQNIIILDM